MNLTSMTRPPSSLPFSVDPQRTVCFSGYRIGKMPARPRGAIPPKCKGSCGHGAHGSLNAWCERGYDTFVSGMATGFDLWAAEAVLSVRRVRPDIRLLAFVPYREQARAYDPVSQRSYTEILSQADYVHCLSERYTRNCCLDRNVAMLDHSTVLVCYYDGRPRRDPLHGLACPRPGHDGHRLVLQPERTALQSPCGPGVDRGCEGHPVRAEVVRKVGAIRVYGLSEIFILSILRRMIKKPRYGFYLPGGLFRQHVSIT